MFSRFKSIVYRKDTINLFFKRLLSKCVFEKIRLPLSLQLSKYDCRCKSKEFFLQLQPLQPVQIGHLQRWSKWTYMEDETIMPLSKFQKTLRVSFALATDAEITLVRRCAFKVSSDMKNHGEHRCRISPLYKYLQ